MVVLRMETSSGGNVDRQGTTNDSPSSDNTPMDTTAEASDIDIWKYASEDYKSVIVPFHSKRGKGANVQHPPDKYRMANGLVRQHRIVQCKREDVLSGRGPRWTELELTGNIRVLPLEITTDFQHLTALHLSNNQLSRLPAEIANLKNLVVLNVSNNKLRTLPSELGDMISLCHLYLDYNQLRLLPNEIGKLFRLTTLSLRGNPLFGELAKLAVEPDATQRVLHYLLDHLASRSIL